LKTEKETKIECKFFTCKIWFNDWSSKRTDARGSVDIIDLIDASNFAIVHDNGRNKSRNA